jgi:hypothetical protein
VVLPESLIFFTLKHDQNVSLALDEIASLVRQSNEMWQTTIAQWLDEAVENVRGTVRYYKIEQN